MQDLSQLPPVISKPISDKGIETVLSGAVEDYPLATLLCMLFFLSFIAFLVYRLARYIIATRLISSIESRKSQDRINKLDHEIKRLELEASKKKKPPKRR
jgi:hypothetical protein